MTLEQIRKALLDLTIMRSRTDDNLMGHIRKSLQPEGQPRPTYDQLRQSEQNLEASIPGFYVIWDKVNACYGIIPEENYKGGE